MITKDMNSNLLMEPRLAAIIGALVADAAALGLHWLYDTERIAHVEKTTGLVFLSPDQQNYRDVSGYFAHGNKTSGDSSGYGELCLFMLRHYARHGRFDRLSYQSEYCAFFGPGGGYQGYVDFPMRQTLQVLLPLKMEDFPEQSGADDDQFAALSTLPVVVTMHSGTIEALMMQIERIVRITNNNADALSAAKYAGSVLWNVLQGKSIHQALTDSLAHAGEKLTTRIEQALQTPKLSCIDAAKRFGSSCHVLEGMPLIAHILQHAHDFRSVVQENIRVGGDSCGRSIMLGAIMASQSAMQSKIDTAIPLEWLARYRKLIVAADAWAKLSVSG